MTLTGAGGGRYLSLSITLVRETVGSLARILQDRVMGDIYVLVEHSREVCPVRNIRDLEKEVPCYQLDFIC